MRATATKAGRLELQNYEFTSLIDKGYSRADYGELKIFTMTDKDSTWLKIFRGTASKEVVYKRYRTEAQAVEAIKNCKASHDRSKAYKAELKANPIKSSSANCATAIREELKKEFPTVKFSVKSSNFAGGDSVDITWENGPIVQDVESITRKYQYGRFDGMTDSYEYSNSREDLPQSKYVQTRREINEEVNNIVFEALRPHFSEDTPDYEVKQYGYRIIYKTPIPVGAIVTGLKEIKDCGSIEDIYTLVFDLSNVKEVKAEPKETTNFEAVEVKAGEVSIIDYSEKSIAVIGDTKPIKEQLKELGGKFNFRLSCGAGWIFQKSKLEEVQNLLNGEDPTKNENGSFNIEGHLTIYDSSGKDITETLKEEPTTLHDEVEETINFLADLDVKIYGEVSESVRECARVQEVEIHHEAIQATPSNTQLTFFL